ncbi:hypothetical protein SAMN05216275_12584 [Streptosporangium canum]|uniref:Uncharacterized protein n=1 Tax=Streptosporangium canum TaxID=324952 RepID=A0A1I3ZLX5_9ACTN|nr:hypothetical protein SAMN05216275_12584 [Streptosporangium canum]
MRSLAVVKGIALVGGSMTTVRSGPPEGGPDPVT